MLTKRREYSRQERRISRFQSNSSNLFDHRSTTRRFEDATYLRIGVLLVRGPAMTLVVAPAIISAGRAWVRVLDRGCGRTAVGYLRLVGLVRALVRLAGCSRRLVHPLLGTGPVTGSAGVMHRTSRPFTSPREPRSLHRRANQRSTPRTTSLLAAAPRAGPSSLFTAPRRAHHPRRPDLTRAQRGPGWMMDRVRQGRTVSPPSGQLSRALLLSPSVVERIEKCIRFFYLLSGGVSLDKEVDFIASYFLFFLNKHSIRFR